jgi:3-hydroxyacyl-[acyl-carrier-protein] dehydratase
LAAEGSKASRSSPRGFIINRVDMEEQKQTPTLAEPPRDIDYIMSLLPHRYPFLLIDRILSVVPGEQIVALKNVTINEPFFNGHFPGYPIMPGVLIVEAIAQAGGALLLSEFSDHADKLMLFASIDNARFRKPVRPGDQLRIEVAVLKRRATLVKMGGKVFVDGALVSEAEVMCQLVERKALNPAAE